MSRGSELVALVSLLGDDSPPVAAAALREVRARGLSPAALLDISEAIDGAGLRLRVRDRVEAIRLASLEERLRDLVRGGDGEERPCSDVDLERGAFILTEADRGTIDERRYSEVIDQIAGRARKAIDGRRTGRDRLTAFARFLHETEGFTGSEEEYYDPRNSYLPDVLERRTGIPITLSLVYMLVGRRLGLRFQGVGMPAHFILRFESPGFGSFLDPFHAGRLLSVADCRELLHERGQPFRLEFLRPTPTRAILARMHRNLMQIHVSRNATRRASTLARFLAILEGNEPTPRHPIPWERAGSDEGDEDDPRS